MNMRLFLKGQGWIFLSSKLLRNETGLLTPHPLKVEFSVDAPVYPIKLTSLVDSGTELLLFVKSLVPYEHPSLHIQFTDKVNITGSKENNNLQVRLEHFERYIWDNGELAGLLEGDGWLSCFRSRLYPGDMKEDLILSKSSLENPYRDMFYTPRGAAAHAVSLVLWIFTIAFPILGISFRLRRKAGKKALLILAVMAVLIALVYGFSLPVNSRIRSFRKYDDSSYRSQLRETIWRINSENYGSEEDFRNAVMQELGKSHRNFYTGDILRIEHSPGNMAFERKNDGGLRIIWYDDSCSKHTLYGF
jgi:hypothetical protein